MYYSYFGLQEAPFSIAVNPRYLYMSPSHRDALAHLLYGVGAGGGFILLTGEVGTGKTTINRCLIEQLPDNADLAIVLNPALDARDLLATVCEELEILPEEEAPGLKELTDALHRFLLANHARGRKTVLLIDEAQHLSFEVLEQIRLLTNLETNEEKLLHIILIGQPELGARLARPELRQLNQRITARYDLSPLSREDTAAYIRHRLHIAGLPPGRTLFPERLINAIHRESRGVPRLINLLCDRLLLGAYGRSADRPDRALLRTAVEEVLGGEAAPVRRHGRGLLLAVAAAIACVALALWALLREPAPMPAPAPLAAAPPATTDALPPRTGPPGAAPAPSDALSPADAPWFLAPAAGTRVLGHLYAVDAQALAVSDPCRLTGPAGLECLRRDQQTWQDLAQDRRPALLRLVDSRRVEGRALFLGLEGEEVVLAALPGPEGTGAPGEPGLVRVPLGTLGALWTGEAWQLWRRPPAIGRSLGPGDEGADVAAAAALFARLDGQARALGDGRYDGRLQERVRLFQRATGLEADGVLGERTLRALVLATGDDIDLPAARRRLSTADFAAGSS